jgi:predicted exporter
MAAGALLARSAPVETDLMALLPPTERSAAAERAVRSMARVAGDRAVFLVGHADVALARRAAEAFAGGLRASEVFASVQLEVPDLDPREFASQHRAFRFGLLTEDDRGALAGGDFDLEQSLLRRINDPFAPRLAAGVRQDPFGFFDNFVASLPYGQTRLDMEDGLLVARAPSKTGGTYVLVSAGLAGSAFDDAVQRPALAAVARAELAAQAAAADVEVLRTGTVFFAEAARRSAERDVQLIGSGSLAGIVLLMLAVFRSLRPLVLGVATVATGLVAAGAAGVLALGQLHLFTLVFGASLIGEAIDYSLQYFGAYAGAGSHWDARKGMLSVRPGLTLALATSALGYAALLFMPFPAVQQIAFFALVGLAAAYLCVIFILPRLLTAPYRRDIAPLAAPVARFLDWCLARVKPRVALAAAALLAALFVPGWLNMQANDDVRVLADRPAGLLEQEARIRALTGVEIGARFYVVEAADAEGVLRAEERLAARLRQLAQDGSIVGYQAVSSFVPSAARQQENRALLLKRVHGDGKLLERAFEQVGLRPGLAGELTQAYQHSEGHVLTADAWLASAESTPFRHLWLGRAEHGYASVVVPLGAKSTEMLATAAYGLEGVQLVDKAASVSRLFAQYREVFSYGLAVAVVLIFGLLSLRYGARGAVAALMPPLLGAGGALALAGYSGSALTLFTIMALVLVLGSGINYAIFMIEGRARPGTTGIAVALSAATTILSFGLLSLSGMPALSSFGATLLAGIAIAACTTPLAVALAPRPAR